MRRFAKIPHETRALPICLATPFAAPFLPLLFCRSFFAASFLPLLFSISHGGAPASETCLKLATRSLSLSTRNPCSPHMCCHAFCRSFFAAPFWPLPFLPLLFCRFFFSNLTRWRPPPLKLARNLLETCHVISLSLLKVAPSRSASARGVSMAWSRGARGASSRGGRGGGRAVQRRRGTRAPRQGARYAAEIRRHRCNLLTSKPTLPTTRPP